MTDLIIGANGFIGAHVARRLVSAERPVSLVLGSGNRWRLDALGVTQPAITLESIPWKSVTSVCFAAGFGTPSSLSRETVGPVGRELALHRDVLHQVLENRVDPLIIVMGSRTQYGTPRELPVLETHPQRPRSAYALEKKMIEDLYQLAHDQAGVRSLRLRVTNPYGTLEWEPTRRHGLISIFIAQLLRSGAITVFGEGEEQRDYLCIDDLVDLVARAVIHGGEWLASEDVNAGSGVGTSIRAVAEIVLSEAEQLGLAAGRIDHVAVPASASAVESGSFVASIDRVQELLGWHPAISLRDGVRALIGSDLDRIARAVADDSPVQG